MFIGSRLLVKLRGSSFFIMWAIDAKLSARIKPLVTEEVAQKYNSCSNDKNYRNARIYSFYEFKKYTL